MLYAVANMHLNAVSYSSMESEEKWYDDQYATIELLSN